ncbi:MULTISPECIES: hypothetical protein [unclassified Sphingomonas]|uniref:ORC-CDC6 family AAA ATPase n=1 Tax=unclassified Sphingomonas TaxID=196159 RepID=UPI0009EC9D8B|nr:MULTISPECIES: hypothetical protein [unclassified Sphingomonas]
MPGEDNSGLQEIHKIFLDVDKRAERSTGEILDATFVDSAPLFDVLSTRNNQVVYGRRGTGKTHALRYLQKQLAKSSAVSLYIDMRNVGSNGSIYGDTSRSVPDRAGILVRDVLTALLDEFYAISVEALDTSREPARIASCLDDFGTAISEVRISGPVEEETSDTSVSKKAGEAELSAKIWPIPGFDAKAKVSKASDTTDARKFKRSGIEKFHINFGKTASALSALISALGVERVWLLVDEWSEVPIDLQPYLADLIRRTLLPERLLTVKIAAIEHRSQFIIRGERGSYVGVELGADIAADLNLDDFLVFENSAGRSVEFFKTLLFKHLKASDTAPNDIANGDELISRLFSQSPVFEEFVRAVEGVPRDALNLVTKMVTRAWGRKITVQDVRGAAQDWYIQDKARDIRDNHTLGSLLEHIITEVIGKRKARGFLFAANTRNELIDTLFDARVLHILKRGTSSHDEPGVRYDVYKIDYGCYVELINTSKAPGGLYQEDEDSEFVEVPKDDHRSIRRAILRLD